MSTKALIGILLAGTTGVLIFLFVHLSEDSSKVSIGAVSPAVHLECRHRPDARRGSCIRR